MQDGLWREVYQRWFWGWTWDSSRVRREHPGDHARKCRWKDFFLENCFLDRTQGYRILSTASPNHVQALTNRLWGQQAENQADWSGPGPWLPMPPSSRRLMNDTRWSMPRRALFGTH